jgi:hypothetical protein
VTNLDIYYEILASEGFRPERRDAENTLRFKVEGKHYRLQWIKDDPDYVRLTTIFNLDGVSQDVAFRAASEVSRRLKSVKASIPPEGLTVVFAWEAFYKHPDHAALYITRALGLLSSAVTTFFDHAKALRARAGTEGTDTKATG